MECRFLVQSIPIPNRVPEMETISALMYESSGAPFSKEISSSVEISIEYSVEISTENGPPELSYLCAGYSTSEF